MNHRIIFVALMVLFASINSRACQAECQSTCNATKLWSCVQSKMNNIGNWIENKNVPAVGKLGNILPFACLAFCLQKFPGQTLALLSCGVAYGLYCNEKVRDIIACYTGFGNRNSNKEVLIDSREDLFDENFFVFDGEEKLDAEEEEDMEDDLLDDELNQKTIIVPVQKPLSFL